jgi:hypothetical protein
MFVIDFSSAAAKTRYPVRNVRLDPNGGTLAATLGARGKATEAVWWRFADDAVFGRSSIYPPGDPAGWYTSTFADPVFTPDLARCAFHGYAPGSGSVEFHSVGLIAPGEEPGPGFGDADEDFDEDSDEAQKRGDWILFASDYGEETLEALALSPDGRWLLAGHGGGRLSRTDLKKAKFKRKPVTLPESEPVSLSDDPEDEWDADAASALAVSPDNKCLATGHVDGEVRLFNFRSRKQLAVLQPPARTQTKVRIDKLCFSADGTRLAALDPGGVTVFDPTGGSVLARLKTGRLTDMAFHPDGTRVFTGGLDKLVRVWETAAWKQVKQFDWKVGPIHSVAVGPDGLTAVAGGEKNRAVVWDLEE